MSKEKKNTQNEKRKLSRQERKQIDKMCIRDRNETFNYLRRNGIYSLEDLESRVSEHSAAIESLKKTLDEQTARMKVIKRLYDSSAAFQNLKPVYDLSLIHI